jgi:outer membrane protein assembly factor BamB
VASDVGVTERESFVRLGRRGMTALAFLVAVVVAGCGSTRHAAVSTHSRSTPTVTRSSPGVRPVYASWPQYGRNPQRTGFAGDLAIGPPYRVKWAVDVGKFLEFPPAIAGGRLFVATDAGKLLALDSATGAIDWSRGTSRCSAASPAVRGGVVYFALMGPPPCGHQPQSGRVIAVRARDGKRLWAFSCGASESSPLVVGQTVYVGSQDGRLYALDAGTGRERWSFQTGGKIKGGAAFADGAVFVGSYDGRVYAIEARSGRLRWAASVGAPIYATPAIGAGRLIVGTLAGEVYALDLSDGRASWTRRTGSYVYSSAAISGDTAFVGSYDGHLYALGLADGSIRWDYGTGSPVSGTPTVVDGVVYFSRCLGCWAGRTFHLPPRTFAVDAASGRLLWDFPDGEYTPVVTDGRLAFLDGYTRLYALRASRRS